MAVPAPVVDGKAGEHGVVQSMSGKGDRIGNGAAGQVSGHLKDESFRARTWEGCEGFKKDLDVCVAHPNARRGQVRLKGPAPEEFRNQSLAI